jgi:hypothetical protein
LRGLTESSPERIDDVVFTFWEPFNDIWLAPDFHIYDSTLRAVLSEVHEAWHALLSFGQYYQPGQGKYVRWYWNHPYSEPAREDAYTLLTSKAPVLRQAIEQLARLIHEQYLEIDLEEAKRESWEWFRRHEAELFGD